jgi:hypothetical protein
VISQVGFISIVIPDFATGSVSLDKAWIGRINADGNWREVPADETIEVTP